MGYKHLDIVRNIKALAYAKLKRFDDAYYELKAVLEAFSATEPNKRHLIYRNVVWMNGGGRFA